MKKILCLLSSILMLSALSGCIFNPQTKKVSYENTILTKNECLTEIKELLRVTDIYYFDCNFNNMNSLSITEISYNISVSATLLYDSENKRYYADLNEQCDIKIVANYKIEENKKCFGFSIISSVIQPKMDHYENEKLVKTTSNIIYDKDTYSTINKLYNNGSTTYGDNAITVLPLKVPKNFYPCDLTNNGVSVKSNYLKINGDINSSNKLDIIDTPISILAHYNSYSDSNNSPTPLIKDLINYYNDNAVYAKH